ncbi:MAG: TolC family protein [Alphaproteobacteria bacterium]|nr:TolC family protein [Alphaproteobacteria bacterium]
MKIFLQILFFIFLTSNLNALNIDEAIKSTILNNPKVKIAIEKLTESKELISYAYGSKKPTLTSTISGTYANADKNTSTASTTPETLTDKYQLTVSQNLYDAGYNELEIARSKILFNDEVIQFKITLQSLILEAIEGYLTVINYEKYLEANQKNYDSMSKAFEETKTRFDIGSATLYELQNAEASFATASSNLFAAEQNVQISNKSFKRVVGLQAINLEDVLNINNLVNLSNTIETAMDQNLNLLLAISDIENKKILLLKEKKSKKPSLDISGTAEYSDSGRIDSGTKLTQGSVALTLTIPLYQKDQDNSNIRKYHSQILQSEIYLEDFREDIQIQIYNTYKDFKISESNMSTNQIVIQSIETSLNSLNEEYNIGTKTITDLVNEEEKLLNANVNYLNSKKNFITNYFKLKSLDGSLIKLFEHYIPATN